MSSFDVKKKCKSCSLYSDSELFCANLTGSELCDLSDHSRTLTMKRGDTLEGDALAHWPIVAVDSGVISIQHLLQDGRKTIAALFMRGDIIDLRNISNRNRGALVALGKVSLCRMAPKVFERIMAANLDSQRIVWENLRDQAYRAIDHSADIAKKQALEKLASFVFECRNRQVNVGPTEAIDIPVRRVDLAEYLGMQPETVSRGFKDLESHGVLDVVSLNVVKITDLERLRRIADGDKDAMEEKSVSPAFKVLQFA